MIVTPGNPRTDWRRPNPLGETPDRARLRPHISIAQPGDSPGLMEWDDREYNGQAAGTIRRLWRQVVSGIPAPPPVDVSSSPAIFTRAIRYRAQSTYLPAGSMNSRFTNLHTVIRQASRQPRPTLSAGTRRGRPTVRNRMQSFGSRVTPLNRRAPAAQAPKT